MNNRVLFLLLLLVLIVAACSPTTAPTDPALPASPTDTQIPTSTTEPATATPTFTLIPATPTETPSDQIVVITNQPPNIVLTAMSLQLEDSQAQLTQSAGDISTLQAEVHALETQSAAAATNAAGNSSSNSGSNTGGSGSSTQEYVIPSNVYTVTVVDKATIFVASTYNNKGAPVMVPYKPRVYVDPGTTAWVYKSQVVADGGTIFYESYDPDGEASDLKVFFRAAHIQIRLPNGKPDPDNYPGNVAKAQFVDSTVLFIAASYDLQGKPAMTSYKPLIQYKPGDFELLYPNAITATGGALYYPVYDPDGTPSGYIRADKVIFPQKWE